MWLDTRSMLVAALVAVAAIPSSLATPSSGSPCCKYKCSPSQIDAAFRTPKYLSDTKAFCRKYLHLPAKTTITKTKKVTIPVYYTKTKVETKTAVPVTITRTSTRFTTVVGQETSLATNTDVSTISSTSTILVVSTSDVTETDYVIATSNVVDTITVTTTATSTATGALVLTVTTYTSSAPLQKMKRLDSTNENEIQIFKRGGQPQRSYAFKIPSYLPQDLNPQQISWACKRISPCSTKTVTVTSTVKERRTVSATKYTRITPPASTTTRTVIKTVPKTNTVQQTVVTTIFYTTVTSITVTAQTVTETIATETQTTATITTTVETDTVTQTASETVSETVTQTVTLTLPCNTGITLCSLDQPESCCSGRCVKFFANPNCCVGSGQPCDIYHPEGCCSGTCRNSGNGNYKCD
ncbi:hypothetical protein TWF281_008505 [Arthrobotrys megalospora]